MRSSVAEAAIKRKNADEFAQNGFEMNRRGGAVVLL
jgi:hypothetical protein